MVVGPKWDYTHSFTYSYIGTIPLGKEEIHVNTWSSGPAILGPQCCWLNNQLLSQTKYIKINNCLNHFLMEYCSIKSNIL